MEDDKSVLDVIGLENESKGGSGFNPSSSSSSVVPAKLLAAADTSPANSGAVFEKAKAALSSLVVSPNPAPPSVFPPNAPLLLNLGNGQFAPVAMDQLKKTKHGRDEKHDKRRHKHHKHKHKHKKDKKKKNKRRKKNDSSSESSSSSPDGSSSSDDDNNSSSDSDSDAASKSKSKTSKSNPPQPMFTITQIQPSSPHRSSNVKKKSSSTDKAAEILAATFGVDSMSSVDVLATHVTFDEQYPLNLTKKQEAPMVSANKATTVRDGIFREEIEQQRVLQKIQTDVMEKVIEAGHEELATELASAVLLSASMASKAHYERQVMHLGKQTADTLMPTESEPMLRQGQKEKLEALAEEKKQLAAVNRSASFLPGAGEGGDVRPSPGSTAAAFAMPAAEVAGGEVAVVSDETGGPALAGHPLANLFGRIQQLPRQWWMHHLIPRARNGEAGGGATSNWTPYQRVMLGDDPAVAAVCPDGLAHFSTHDWDIVNGPGFAFLFHPEGVYAYWRYTGAGAAWIADVAPPEDGEADERHGAREPASAAADGALVTPVSPGILASWGPAAAGGGGFRSPTDPGILVSRGVPAPAGRGSPSSADPGSPEPRGVTGSAGSYQERDVRDAVALRGGDRRSTTSVECGLTRQGKHVCARSCCFYGCVWWLRLCAPFCMPPHPPVPKEGTCAPSDPKEGQRGAVCPTSSLSRAGLCILL
jgi:hypothetical protein